jgi:DNA-binding Lrp family transcriptional regulator
MTGSMMMKTEFQQRIVEMLRSSPRGLTATEIAEGLGTTAGSVSSRLSKLAAYGIINRARATLVSHGSRGNLYHAAKAHLADDLQDQG